MTETTSTNPIVRCPYCSNPMKENKYTKAQGYYYCCYACKVTIEVIKSIAEL